MVTGMDGDEDPSVGALFLMTVYEAKGRPIFLSYQIPYQIDDIKTHKSYYINVTDLICLALHEWV
jgi:hypothetical protein